MKKNTNNSLVTNLPRKLVKSVRFFSLSLAVKKRKKRKKNTLNTKLN